MTLSLLRIWMPMPAAPPVTVSTSERLAASLASVSVTNGRRVELASPPVQISSRSNDWGAEVAPIPLNCDLLTRCSFTAMLLVFTRQLAPVRTTVLPAAITIQLLQRLLQSNRADA